MTQPKTSIAAMFDEAWGDADFRFDIKAQEVATDLARALEEAGMTRTQLCEKLEWKPSRMSKVLGGGANLTLRTLYQLCEAVGLEFDVILRPRQQPRTAQPWEADHLQDDIRRLHSEAEHKHVQSRALLETALQISHSAWQRANRVNTVAASGHGFVVTLHEARG